MSTIFAGLTALLFASDMLFKQYIEEEFTCEEERGVLKNKVVLRKVYNRGFMLHFLDKYPQVIKGVSIVMGVAAIADAFVLFLKKGRWIRKLGTAVCTAGAASNLFDRLVRGKVIDYIGFRSRNSFLSRLTINLADVFILGGTAIVAISSLVAGKKKK